METIDWNISVETADATVHAYIVR